MVLKGFRAQQGPQALLVLKVLLALLASREFKVLLDLTVHKGRREVRGQPALKG